MKVNKTDEVIKLVKDCGRLLISRMEYDVDASEISDEIVDLIRAVEDSSAENKNLMFKDGEIMCCIGEEGVLQEIPEGNVVSIIFEDEADADEFARIIQTEKFKKMLKIIRDDEEIKKAVWKGAEK